MERIFRRCGRRGRGRRCRCRGKAVAQVSGNAEQRVEGLNLWFDHAMDLASQRFTVQARVITVLFSVVLVLRRASGCDPFVPDALHRCAADGHNWPAVRMPSSNRLNNFRGGQRERLRDRLCLTFTAARWLSILELTPPAAEQAKAKPHHSTHGMPPRLRGLLPHPPARHGSDTRSAGIDNVSPEAAGETGQTMISPAQALPEAPKKERKNKAAAPKKQSPSEKGREKSGAAPGENKAIVEAKAKASKALESSPGFASREDAVLWLRATLDGDPAARKSCRFL